MTENMRKYILTLLSLVAAMSSFAVDYDFSTITLNDGLSQSTVRSTLRDSRGYLWIGTKSGLNRYDGGRMKTYWNETDKDKSLPDNAILSLLEDDRDTIWVICEKGLARYNRLTDTFERVRYNDKSLNVRSFHKTGNGIIFGGSGSLYFYDYKNSSLKQIPVKGGSRRYYNGIHPWTQGHYVLSTRWDGLWLYEESTKQISRLELCPEKDIMATLVDSSGNLWVSPYGGGLICYDKNGRDSFHIGSETLGSDIILDILEGDGQLWIATDGGGLHNMDLRTRKVERIDKGVQAPGALRSVTNLYRDRYGYVYAGTVRNGLTCISATPMTTFSSHDSDASYAITSLCSDGNSLWIGVDGGGLALYEPTADDTFTPIASTAGMKITSVEDYDDNHLILSTFDDGLYIFDKKSRQTHRAPDWFTPVVKENARKALPLDIKRLPDDRLAILSDRIYLCDLKSSSIHEVAANRMPSRLNEFYSDLYSMLCFGTDDIVRFNISTCAEEVIATLPGQNISCAAYDGTGFIYIGTSDGLYKYDFNAGAVSPVNRPAVPKHINALIIDNGKLWIGAEGTVWLKDLKTGRLAKFNRYDGVKPNEFIYKSAMSTPSHIFMGGMNGLLKIDREDIVDYLARKKQIPVSVTDIEVDGNSIDINEREVEIPFDHSTVALRLNGGDPHPLNSASFRFFIGSPDKVTPLETTGNHLNVSNLASGETYHIYASAKNLDGTWLKPEQILTLKIALPWWKHPVAFFFYAVLVLLLAFGLYRHLLYNRRQKEVHKIEEYKRQSLEKEVRFLMDVNRELRTPLTLLYARIKMLFERIKGQNGEDPGLVSEIGEIYRTTGNMRDIINSTVDSWCSTELAENVSLDKTDVNQWVKDCIAEFKNGAQGKKLNLIPALSGESKFILFNRNSCSIVLSHILGAAIQKAEAESDIAVRPEFEENRILVTVSFAGKTENISDELSYDESLVRLQGGEIRIETDEENNRTSIVLELPEDAVSKENRENTKRREVTEDNVDTTEDTDKDFDTSGLTVLIAEENGELSEFMRTNLGDMFKRVLLADNGKDALTMIKNSNPDIIVTDAWLPVVSGTELCRTLKRSDEFSHIPVVMLTSRIEELGLDSGRDFGADAYLPKPFDIAVLKKRCRRVLSNFDRVRRRYKSQIADIIPNTKYNNEGESFLLKIKDIIDKNITKPGFSIDIIVEQMLMSRTTLYGKFKDLTGQTLGAYINNYKIHCAKEYLSSTNMTMTEIADALGFSTQRYFSTFFKDKTGLTPSEFRSAGQVS